MLENQKKNYDDKNVCIAIYDPSKSCKNNITYSENDTIFFSWKNGLLKLPKKNIVIPWSLVQMIKMMSLKSESFFLKKIIIFDEDRMEQENLCLFNFFYKIEHLYSFMMYDDKDIKFIMEHVYYAHIIEVFRFNGFPSVAVVEHVKTWIDLKKGYTLDWLWKNLSLHFKEQGVPNKHVFFSLIAEMEKEIELPNQILNYLSEFEKHWFLGKNVQENRNKDDWCMVKKKLSHFFLFLCQQHVNITKLFIFQMKHLDFERMILFCDKCKYFYENRKERSSISSLFLRCNDTAEKLLTYNNEDIKFITTHPFYKNILACYRLCEFPPAAMVRTVDTWVNLKEGITPAWIYDNLSLNFKGSKIPEKEVFFSCVAHVERDINFILYSQTIEYGLKKDKRDNNQKCSDDYNEKNIDKVHALLLLLIRKKIYDVLLFINIILELDADQISDFCDKIIYFYSTAKETRSIVPIFLDSMEKVYLFLENSYEDIKFVAQHSFYRFIVMVYFDVNFPIASCVKEVDAWKCFIGGKNISLIALWTSLAKMFTGCGIPTKEEFLFNSFQLLHNSHDIHEKNHKKKLTAQKIKPNNDNALSLLETDILKDVKSKNKVGKIKYLNSLCSEKSKEKIGELLMFLIKKHIENIALVVDLLFKRVLKFDDNTIADFCNKIMCFYSNTEEKRSLVPSFLSSMKKVNLFLKNTNEEIKFIAQHSCYSEIYKIYFGFCFPKASCVKKFDTWKNIVENITLVSLWKLLAKIFSGLGMPKRGEFLFSCFALVHKQHEICEKKQKNELSLQDKKLNFDDVFLSLLLNADVLNDTQGKNKIANDQEEGGDRRNEDWDEQVLNEIYELFTLLTDKNIENIPSFMDIILKLPNYKITVFCNQVILFYKNNEEKRSIVTIFLNSMKKVNEFLCNNQTNIKFIAQHPYYVHISEVYRGINFPNRFNIQEVESWKEAIQDTTLMYLWKLLAEGFTGYGVPRKEMFFFFFSCCDAFYETHRINK